ncbi:hypothetical protein BD414DRAFT_481942 [Trametes punicea]|nr:hypothetical protein BD414DRAFT_481942 [Trametes punicea]
MATSSIQALDDGSIHKITSGQVVVDLQTAVKELVENSLDAGATTIEVRFQDYGLESFEVIDNGSGIAPTDYDHIALKHHTSKISSFSDLETVSTFGFRGEALSSVCALAESVSVVTATAAEAPVGTVIEFERTGKVKSRKGKAARQRGTTVTVSGLFKPLPVRRKELERNAKREFGKALTLLHAYALVPCAMENKGVRLIVTNQMPGGKKTVQLRTDGVPSTRASVSAIWGPKALETLVDLDLVFNVEVESAVLRRLGKTQDDGNANEVKVQGLISKFTVGCGRNGTDRQFFFVNGRPCAPSKVQKAFNEVYRSFNATQAPFIVADFRLPTDSCDINVSPDKRTILLHSENNLVQALKVALEERYAPARSTYEVNPNPVSTVPRPPHKPDGLILTTQSAHAGEKEPLFLPDDTADGPSTEVIPKDVSEHRNAASSREQPPELTEVQDDITFGEPTLLCDHSSSVVHASDGPSLQEEVPPDVFESVDRENEGQAPLSNSRTEDGLPGHTGRAVKMGPVSISQSGSRSSSSTKMVGVSIVTHAAQERVSDDEPSPRQAALDAAHSTMSTRHKPIATDDLPIPTIKPPARLVTRTSSQAGGDDQMVLSTSGASWSLRRQADPPSILERPRKRSRLDGGYQEAQASSRESRNARQGMRDLLRDFARQGSEIDQPAMDVDEEIEEAGTEVQDAQEDPTSGEASEVPSELEFSILPDRDTQALMDAEIGAESEILEVRGSLNDSTASDSDLPQSSATAVSEEIIRTGDRQSISLAFDLSRVAQSWRTVQTRLASARRMQRVQLAAANEVKQGKPAASVDVDDEHATETLSRVIDKVDFAAMEVVGQFNLGFIIVRRRKSAGAMGGSAGGPMDDLFIVDQHAADEKYNFEALQQTTKIDSQKLFHPQVLELTAADELVALENINVLRQNGFELEVFDDRPPGQRVQLTAQPVSKSTVFDMKDLEELLHLLQDRPAGQMVRSSKARAMFAMRACRKSIMIGKPLSQRQMTSIVQHMGTMDQPWHCPHGRPTMRHLFDIINVGWNWQQGPGGHIDWSAFRRSWT